MKKLILVILVSVISCTAGKKNETTEKTEDPSNKTVNTTAKETLEEFTNPKEGFITQSIFQVVVFSLNESGVQAKSEALDVAKKKSVNLLVSSARQPLSSQGRNEIKSLVEESGKITKESGLVEGKYYFIYQIEKPGLQIYIKDKLN